MLQSPLPIFDDEIIPNWQEWVAISATRNWMSEDPLLDWLDVYGKDHGFTKDSEEPDFIEEADFTEFIKRKGVQFEARVIELLDAKIQKAGFDPIVVLSRESHGPRTSAGYAETLRLMRLATPAIAQAVLWDPERGTYGACDLLVRSDILHHFCEDVVTYTEAAFPAPRIGLSDRHYVVVEIKFRSFKLDSQGEADNSAGQYKAQLALYNAALGEMQGCAPPKAFFLGRGWEKGSGKSQQKKGHCLDRLIPVTLPIQPQFRSQSIDWLAEAIQAVRWIRKVRYEGAGWQALPEPSNDWLRPNMKNHRDAPWTKAKAKIAEATGEPTKLWNVGLPTRNALVEARSSDWRAPDFRIDLALPSPGSTADRLNAMVEVNRRTEAPFHHPPQVDWETGHWQRPEPLEFFVDFETTSNLDDSFENLPEIGGQPLIFMIGCGHYEPTDEPGAQRWVFKVFYAEALTEAEEKRIVFDWYRHMEAVRARIPGAPARPKVFHWSPAETRSYSIGNDSAFERHLRPEGWPDPNWYDFLNNVVKQRGTSNAFYVKDAWGFGLKAIGKALFKHGHVQTEWKDGPADGLAAMGGSWACYEKARELKMPVLNVVFEDRRGHSRLFYQEVVDYNEVDCRVMAECIGFLRSLVPRPG